MGVPGGPIICGLGLLLGESSKLERLPFLRDDGDSSVYDPRIVLSGEFIGEAGEVWVFGQGFSFNFAPVII